MFNIENEYDKYRKESEFIEIDGYDDSGEKIEEQKKKGFNKSLLSLFFVGTISTIGYLGYNSIQKEDTVQKKIVMGVFIEKNQQEKPMNREDIEKGLDNLYQEKIKQQKLNETISSVVDEFMATKTSSYTSKKDISDELNGMVDSFYTQEALPAKLDSMVDDFYLEQRHTQNSRFVTIKEGDTLAKIAKKFYGNPLQYQKIIKANQKLQKTATIYIGQKINIPY